jgi:hypothetical protein
VITTVLIPTVGAFFIGAKSVTPCFCSAELALPLHVSNHLFVALKLRVGVSNAEQLII